MRVQLPDGSVIRRAITLLYTLESELEPENLEMMNVPERRRDAPGLDSVDWRQGLTMMDLSSNQTGPESTFLKKDGKIPESQTSGNLMPGQGELRIPESLTPGNIRAGWNRMPRNPQWTPCIP